MIATLLTGWIEIERDFLPLRRRGEWMPVALLLLVLICILTESGQGGGG